MNNTMILFGSLVMSGVAFGGGASGGVTPWNDPSLNSSAGLLGGALSRADSGSGELRDLEADRPDATESPMTVDAGHWQIESSFAGWSRDRSGGVRTESLTLGETNLKYGLNDWADLQFVFAPYVREEVTVGGVKSTAEGTSDVQVRLKMNLWGNDGESDTALALFPYVTIPTNTATSGEKFEGGLIVPFAMGLTDRVGLGLQGELGYVYDDASGDYEFEFAHTAVLGFDVTDKFGAYVEYLGVLGEGDYEAYASGGLTYDVAQYFRLDLGAVAGLNDAAEEISVFSGFTWKF